MKLSRVSQMRSLDKRAIDEFGIKDELLMENAGIATYSVILDEFGIEDRKFVIFCGIGNNGGDGFVIARKLHSVGGKVKIFILGDPDKFKGSAKLNLKIVEKLSIEIQRVDTAETVRNDLAHSHVIVDAIFGTGLTREVGGIFADVIGLINASGKPVVSVDIPSGVHGDTGMIMGTAVKAYCTVTFGLPKIGNLLFPGYELCGRLYVTHISFPPSIYDNEDMSIEINFAPELPPRTKNGHKGSFGDVLFIAGASSYYGAPYFSALSFMKAGGGYSRLAAPLSMTPFIANKASEIVFAPQKETPSGSISYANKEALLSLSEKVDMVVIGPGLSLEQETAELVRALIKEIRKPVLLDGDGITAVCREPQIIGEREADTVLTPHLGEMARLTGTSVSDADYNKVNMLQKTSRDLKAMIVLKGAHSLIGTPDQRVYINITGNSGMATAGSGDVLTGTIAAMFGLGLPLEDAVRKGVYIHGLSGDIAAEAEGEDGITAQDILDFLPLAVKMDREGLDDYFLERYRVPIVI
ncbi:NAD(P)H-hydrate dehydratase [Thermodesulfobacteriota bacterium]